MFSIHPNLKEACPGTCFGLLVLRDFRPAAGGLAAFPGYAARELEAVRAANAGYDRKRCAAEDPVMAPYVRFYKRFKKSYHVLLQRESILQGKDLPQTLPAVQIMFLTEMQTGMLLAAYDLGPTRPPFSIERAAGGETFLGASGREVTVKAGDIVMRDEIGHILSIIYGQDLRTRITEDTRDVAYLIDGVPGLTKEQMEAALNILLQNLRILQPDLEPERMDVIMA